MATFTITAELLLNGAWTDVTRYVRYRSPVGASRGRGDERATAGPTAGEFSLDNRDGRFSPRNASGPYYGQLGRNTQVRIRVTDLGDATLDDFTRTLSSSWGTAANGLVWFLSGSGTVAFADFAVTGSTGTTSVALANEMRLAFLIDRTWLNGTFYVEATIPAPTGAAITPCIVLRRKDEAASTYYLAQAVVAPGGVVTAQISKIISSSLSTITSAVVPSLTHSAASPIKIRAAIYGSTIAVRIWQGSTEPTVFHVATTDTSIPLGGFPGIRVDVGAGNTNTKPVLVTWDNFRRDATVRLYGEVPAWPVEWDVSGRDVTVPVTVAGLQRRTGRPGASTILQSPLRREALAAANASVMTAYWPLEDAAGSTQAASGIAGGSPMAVIGALTFASRAIVIGSAPTLVTDSTIDVDLLGSVAGHTPTGTIAYRGLWGITPGSVANSTALVDVLTVGGTNVNQWAVEHVTSGFLRIQGFFNGTSVYSTGALGFDIFNDADQMIGLNLVQNGADVDWSLFSRHYVGNTLVQGGLNGTFAGTTVGQAERLWIGRHSGLFGVGVGHQMLGTSTTLASGTFEAAMAGNRGETAGRRIYRLCAESAMPLEWVGNLANTALMGPQSIDSLETLLAEAVAADGGIWYEPRDALGIAYRTRASLYNQAATLALTYGAAGEVAPPLRPQDDDAYTVNDVTVARDGGSSVRDVQQTGPLSILDPPSGVGRYPESVTLNVYADTQLADIASWRLHCGTWDETRFPQINLNLRRLTKEAKTALRLAAAMLDVGDRVTVASPPAWLPSETISQLAQGFTEVITPDEWTIAVNATPERPWQVLQLESTTGNQGRLDTYGSALLTALTSGGTSVLVTSALPPGLVTPPKWSTTSTPYDLELTGEQVTATAVTSNAVAFVNVGAVAHANNASTTPTMPASVTAGDLLLVLAAIRGTSGVVATPAGYTSVVSLGNFALFAKTHTGTETAPTITYSGGAAGDDTSAQMCAFRNAQLKVITNEAGNNGSAQDILYGPMTGIDRANCLVITAGWKQDDWTTTAGPGTKIGDPSTTAGNDQGICWFYEIQAAFPAESPLGTITVTGGAAAASADLMAVFAGDVQTLTLTRAVNGVTKAQTVATPVSLWRPGAIAL